MRVLVLFVVAYFSMAFTIDSIYGIDNRKDIYELSDSQLIGLSQSTVGLAHASALLAVDGGFSLQTQSYRDAMELCPEEKFIDQPSGVFCSGFLIAPDTIVTAGHCVNSGTCVDTRFIFGFKMYDSASAATAFSNDQVYACASVSKREQNNGGADYAVVKLDRPVVGVEPLKLRTGGQIKPGEKLFIMGHPSGLPLKFADDASVRKVVGNDFLVADLDSYGGNSGSAVFNAKSLEVEGILVRGDEDFVYDQRRHCSKSKVCSQKGCRGEDVTLIGNVL